MTESLTDRLASLGLRLPPTPKAVATYIPAALVPAEQAAGLVFISGQLPMVEGKLTATGAVPSKCSEAMAVEAAGQCVLNGLAAVGGVLEHRWDRLIRCVRVGVFVQTEPGFDGAHRVANGASDLIGQILGDAAPHARAAVGVTSLPLDAAVEVELLFAIRPE